MNIFEGAAHISKMSSLMTIITQCVFGRIGIVRLRFTSTVVPRYLMMGTIIIRICWFGGFSIMTSSVIYLRHKQCFSSTMRLSMSE